MINELYRDAELSVLGAILIDPDCAPEIFLAVSESDFVDEDCRVIYQTARVLFAEGTPIAAVTIGARTGPALLRLCNDCVNLTPTSAAWPGYAKVLRDCAAIERATTIIEEMRLDLSGGADRTALRAQAERLIGTLSDGRENKARTMPEMLQNFFERIGRERKYLDWGFDKLNSHVFVEQWFYGVLAARPSIGKTAFALQLAQQMAKTRRVTYFSLETDENQAIERIMAENAMVDYRAIKTGELTQAQLQDLARINGALSKRTFSFVDEPGITIEEIRARVLRDRAEVVFIDYLQLVDVTDKNAKEYERVSGVSRAIQKMAKDLRIAVIALSQLSRIGEYEEPQLVHLRSSGQIEQDADTIMMMYKPPHEDAETEEEIADRECRRILKLAKNRNGLQGAIRFWFNGAIQHFEQEWEHFYDSPVRPMPEEPHAGQIKIT